MRAPSALSLCCLVLCGCIMTRSSPSISPSYDPNDPEEIRRMTAAHNRIRANVSPNPGTPLPALTWSPALAAGARSWAEQCQWGHSDIEGVGENLFATTGRYKPARIVNAWAAEAVDYDYHSNTCVPGKACGHYTQLVWRDTTEIGCAVVYCKGLLDGFSIAQYWVCQYHPPGNYIGKKPY